MILPYRTEGIQRPLDELERWRTRLDYRGVLRRSWLGRLRRELEAEAIAASTSMEGVAVTVEEVRRILAGEKPPEVTDEDLHLVEGYRDAMSFVLRRADDPAFRWNRELIVALHDRILAGSYADGAGRFRTGPAYVTRRATGELVFGPPPPEALPALVDEVCSTMEESGAHPAASSAWVHVAMAAIHPFRDGNGRTARVLASLAMYRGGFRLPEFTSLEEWWGRHLPDYYDAFASLGTEFDPDADVTPFIEAHVSAQLHQVRALDMRQRVQQQIWTALEEVAEDHHLDSRTANALWDAFFGREVTAGYYRGLSDVSRQTATNDLVTISASGLLQPLGERRWRRYLPTQDLYEEVALALGVDGLPEEAEGARGRIIAALSERMTFSGEAFGFERIDPSLS